MPVSSPPSLPERIRARIRADGPLRFDEYLERALYDPDGGFYAGTGGAGRRRDFLTSPEVGPLFGAVLAVALDRWWVEAGRPDPWTVVDAGSGAGRLLPAVLAAGPACAPVLDPVAVDRSAAQRRRTPDGPTSAAELPAGPFCGVVLANELLDNLPWRLLVREAHGWSEVFVDVRRGGGTDGDGELVEVAEPADPEASARADRLAPGAAPGDRIPLEDQAAAWVRDAWAGLERGRLVVIDYASTTAELSGRPPAEWVRTHREHRPGGSPLAAPGSQDITVEVAADQLAEVRPPDEDRSQAAFLRAHGIDDLVAEGRRVWAERAHLGDLAAVRARSRVAEAEALTDPGGLGAFRVLEWCR